MCRCECWRLMTNCSRCRIDPSCDELQLFPVCKTYCLHAKLFWMHSFRISFARSGAVLCRFPSPTPYPHSILTDLRFSQTLRATAAPGSTCMSLQKTSWYYIYCPFTLEVIVTTAGFCRGPGGVYNTFHRISAALSQFDSHSVGVLQ